MFFFIFMVVFIETAENSGHCIYEHKYVGTHIHTYVHMTDFSLCQSSLVCKNYRMYSKPCDERTPQTSTEIGLI